MSVISSRKPQTLTGKVAIVSGSSSGIGAAIAQELSARGASVVINYPYASERKAAETVLQSLHSANEARIVEADLSTLAGPRVLVEATIREFQRLDILVNNAGIAATSRLDDPDEEGVLAAWDRMVNVNGRGTMLLTRAALPHLSPSNSRIINIASASSRVPEHEMTIYSGTKGMVEAFTRCWAKELPRKYGCTVNAIAPGPIATKAMLSAPREFLEIVQESAQLIPVASRFGTVQEVAWAVAMLSEEQSSWINGVYLPVAGGAVMS